MEAWGNKDLLQNYCAIFFKAHPSCVRPNRNITPWTLTDPVPYFSLRKPDQCTPSVGSVTEASASFDSTEELLLPFTQELGISCWLIWRNMEKLSEPFEMDLQWGCTDAQHDSWHFHVRLAHPAFVYSETIHFLIITTNNEKSSQRQNDRELGALEWTGTMCALYAPNLALKHNSFFCHKPTFQPYLHFCCYTFLFLTTWHRCTAEIKG